MERKDCVQCVVRHLDGNKILNVKNTHGGANRNQGRKRPPTLPKQGKLYRLPQVLVGEETIEYLRTLESVSEFVRQAIAEKRERE